MAEQRVPDGRLMMKKQQGSSLIEVLISILVMSFGLLGVGGMIAYAIQLPKMADYRAKAVIISTAMVDRMRGNSAGFSAGNYDVNNSYDGNFTIPALQDCAYPNCTISSLATMDLAYFNRLVRQSLPAGGIRIERDAASGSTDGNLWIIWNEPSSISALSAVNSDSCPSVVSSYTSPAPRCLYIRFKL